MDMDTECNFPELLALDLGAAESVFASKRMTAGPPRLFASPPLSSSSSSSSQQKHNINMGMDVDVDMNANTNNIANTTTTTTTLFGSKSIQDLVDANFLSSQDALAYTSARDFLSSSAFAQLQAHADAITRLTAAAGSPSLGNISTQQHSWDTDSNSMDSFELPSIRLSRPPASASTPSSSFRSRSHHHHHSTSSSTNSTNFNDSYYSVSRTTAHDANQQQLDAMSVSSYDVSVPAISSDRHQSVASAASAATAATTATMATTAATSVSLDCCHSTQSTRSTCALSAMAPPPSPAASGLSCRDNSSSSSKHAGPTTRDAAAAAKRHVEFDLPSAEEPQEPPKEAPRPVVDIKESSWMSFDDNDDDDDDDLEDDDEPCTPALSQGSDDLPPHPPKTATTGGAGLQRPKPDFGGDMARWAATDKRRARAATLEPPRTTLLLSSSSSATPSSQYPAAPSANKDEHRRCSSLQQLHAPLHAAPAVIMGLDDCESDCDNNNELEGMFGDFAGAYNNYDDDEEGHQDKILVATAIPFSRQNTLSLRSLPSHDSLLSIQDTLFSAASPKHQQQQQQQQQQRHQEHHHQERHHQEQQYYPHYQPTPMPRHRVLTPQHQDETSANLQTWIRHAARTQPELSMLCQKGVFFEEEEEDEDEVENEPPVQPIKMASTSVSAPQQLLPPQTPSLAELFYQPGLVGIPLPREVVDTLRVSVSCFPETMLSLSSFSIQTIRSYTRKVRRRSREEADSAHRLIMSHPPVGAAASPQPPSPTTTTTTKISLMAPSRASTSSSSTTSHSQPTAGGGGGGRRQGFWRRLPKRLTLSRTTSSLGLRDASSSPRDASSEPVVSSSSGRSCAASSVSSSSQRRASRMDSFFFTSSSSASSSSSTKDAAAAAAEDQDKTGGVCFKRIFPSAADSLCDALYAHIIAFNYISLLCPPPPPNAPSAPSPPSPPSAAPAPTKRHANRVSIASRASLPESAAAAAASAAAAGRTIARPMSRLENSILSSPSSSPPASDSGLDSGGLDSSNNNSSSRVYNLQPKAVMLLGLLDILEPDNNKGNNVGAVSPSTARPASARPDSSHSSSLSRRYSQLRASRHSSSSGGKSSSVTRSSSYKASTLSRVSPATAAVELLEGDGGDAPKQIKKTTIAVPAAVIDAPTASSVADAAAAAAEHNTPVSSSSSASSPGSPASAATDATMRSLQTGLHGCISQLVATMKLANGQLSRSLLDADVNANVDHTQDIDPLFLRTLCELVRAQEEQR